MGHQVESWHPQSVGTHAVAGVAARIWAGHYSVVCLNLPLGAHSVPARRWTNIVGSLAQWARLAQSAGGAVSLAGLRGRCWKHPEVQQLLTDGILHETWFALCNLPVQDDHQLRTAEVWDMYLSKPCRCSHDAPHRPRTEEPSERRRSAQALLTAAHEAYFPTIITALHQSRGLLMRSSDESASSQRPDSGNLRVPRSHGHDTTGQGSLDTGTPSGGASHSGTPSGGATAQLAFPTEAREKAKLKERAGHKAKKKVQLV